MPNSDNSDRFFSPNFHVGAGSVSSQPVTNNRLYGGEPPDLRPANHVVANHVADMDKPTVDNRSVIAETFLSGLLCVSQKRVLFRTGARLEQKKIFDLCLFAGLVECQ